MSTSVKILIAGLIGLGALVVLACLLWLPGGGSVGSLVAPVAPVVTGRRKSRFGSEILGEAWRSF